MISMLAGTMAHPYGAIRTPADIDAVSAADTNSPFLTRAHNGRPVSQNVVSAPSREIIPSWGPKTRQAQTTVMAEMADDTRFGAIVPAAGRLRRKNPEVARATRLKADTEDKGLLSEALK
ncbi:hypothetical protein [Streptomyces sp. IBSNAI001]|uniref:hypothetical protein n=1 Tax=Streptomyces sp. IBSNAI001 TaxID=3457499 RepID=UPI003FCFD79E